MVIDILKMCSTYITENLLLWDRMLLIIKGDFIINSIIELGNVGYFAITFNFKMLLNFLFGHK